jgi:hypothetical protein
MVKTNQDVAQVDVTTFLKMNAPKSICNRGIIGIDGLLTVKELLDLYKEHIDFCFNADFPNMETLLRYGASELAENGFFVNATAELKNPDFTVALGSSKIKVGFEGYKVSQVFAKNETVIEIMAKDNAYVIVDVFDKCKVKVESKDSALVFINLFGKAKVEIVGNVKVIKKHKNKY